MQNVGFSHDTAQMAFMFRLKASYIGFRISNFLFCHRKCLTSSIDFHCKKPVYPDMPFYMGNKKCLMTYVAIFLQLYLISLFVQ